MPWVGLQCVIAVFPDHTHLLFVAISINLEQTNKTKFAAGSSYFGGEEKACFTKIIKQICEIQYIQRNVSDLLTSRTGITKV